MRNLDQKGAVSLISVVIFAIILAIITSAYMFTVIAQQRQAITYDFSTRAYYAAESGVQDAVRALASDPDLRTNGQQNCKPARGGAADGSLGQSADYNLRYTCQIIDVEPTNVSGVLGESQNVTVRLNPANNNVNRLVVYWSQPVSLSGDDVELCPRQSTSPSGDDKLLPSYEEWTIASASCRIHPMLRLNIIDHASSGSFSESQIRQQVRFLNPMPTTFSGSGGEYAVAATIDPSAENTNASRMEQMIAHAKCYASTDGTAFANNYLCRAIIDVEQYNFSNRQLYVRLRSIYASNVAFQLALWNGNDNPVPLNDTQATIDVTAQAGNNVYRRVRQTVNTSNSITVDYLPDAGVGVGDGICKQFGVGVSLAHFISGCTP